MTASTITIYSVAVLFAGMGLGSILKPTLTSAQFGIRELNREGRNEVRAVYGGFGLAMSITLVVAALIPDLRSGVTLTVALSLGGMAVGRLVSALMDQGIGRIPLLYLGLELAGFAMLLWTSALL